MATGAAAWPRRVQLPWASSLVRQQQPQQRCAHHILWLFPSFASGTESPPEGFSPCCQTLPVCGLCITISGSLRSMSLHGSRAICMDLLSACSASAGVVTQAMVALGFNGLYSAKEALKMWQGS